LFTLTACGGGGSSGWSKTDERRFRQRRHRRAGLRRGDRRLFLAVRSRRLRHVRRVRQGDRRRARLGRCHRSREALHQRGHRRVPREPLRVTRRRSRGAGNVRGHGRGHERGQSPSPCGVHSDRSHSPDRSLGLQSRSGLALRQLPVRVWVPDRKIPVRRERPLPAPMPLERWFPPAPGRGWCGLSSRLPARTCDR
jgi:hypothetical protein